jgi:ethanolamine utilization protein EutN
MRIARILGTVTLNRSLDSFAAARLRVAVPLELKDLDTDQLPATETVIVWDELGAGEGSLIALSEGGEAAQPFHPELKPVDAYNSALLDQLDY